MKKEKKKKHFFPVAPEAKTLGIIYGRDFRTAAILPTICSPSDCTFMRLCSSLYGKALSICNLAKLFRS
jgi:hypothetical protein